jgi:DNA-binding CsgD family transcriptional regulator
MAWSELTRRQRDILGRLEQGLTNKEIGAALGISESGVKAHVSRLLLRYGVPNRVALLRAAKRDGTDGGREPYRAISRDLREIDRSFESFSARGIDIGDAVAALRRMDGGMSDRFAEGATRVPAKARTPRVARAVSEVRAALAGLQVAFDLAERLPPEALRGPLLEVLRDRVRAALLATEGLDREFLRAAPRRAAKAGPRLRRPVRRSR